MNDMTADLAHSNSLADLAARIKAEHEATTTALKRGAEHAMAAGELLLEVKARLKHGQWLPWLKDNCAISERTAQLYMRLAKARPEVEAKSAAVADLSLRGAVAALAPDEMDRARALAEAVRDADRHLAHVVMEKVENELKPFAEWFFALDPSDQQDVLGRIPFRRSQLHRWLHADPFEVAHRVCMATD